jgi:hypothetical protein
MKWKDGDLHHLDIQKIHKNEVRLHTIDRRSCTSLAGQLTGQIERHWLRGVYESIFRRSKSHGFPPIPVNKSQWV